jgi:hypothetical protein
LSLERTAIERALREEPNITEAAHALGSSRRTLQSRMRDYGIAPGKAGRPRQLLPYKSFRPFSRPFERVDASSLALTLIGALGVGGLIWWWTKKDKPATVVAGSGLDSLGAV